jgi:hypothetical protein
LFIAVQGFDVQVYLSPAAAVRAPNVGGSFATVVSFVVGLKA